MLSTRVRFRFIILFAALLAMTACRQVQVIEPIATKAVIRVELSPALAGWSERLGACGARLETSALNVETLPISQLSLDASDLILRLGKKTGDEPYLGSPGSVSVQFLQHPGNPLQQLSLQELTTILSGETTHWDDVGAEGMDSAGEGLPIQLVSLGADDDLTAWLRTAFLRGSELGVKTMVAGSAESLRKIVADTPGSFCLLPSQEFPGAGKALAVVDANGNEITLAIPVLAITAGQPEQDLRQLLLCLQESEID